MKSCVNVFLSVALAAAAHAGEVRLPLDGEWDLAGTNAAGRTVFCAMSVPGDVQSALLASGEIVDPFFGANETNVQWVGQVEWRLKRVFRCSSKMARLPSVSRMKWDDRVFNGICDSLSLLVEHVPCYTLGCRPDKEAADICAATVKVN